MGKVALYKAHNCDFFEDVGAANGISAQTTCVKNSCTSTYSDTGSRGISCSVCRSKSDRDVCVETAKTVLRQSERSCKAFRSTEPAKDNTGGKFGATVFCDSCARKDLVEAQNTYSCLCSVPGDLKGCLEDANAEFKKHGGCSAVGEKDETANALGTAGKTLTCIKTGDQAPSKTKKTDISGST